jgi:glyceraldehyde-3-phosphate dehydrogenase (EC 1.2.1.12)
MTTIHAYTNDQVLTDVYHSDPYRARSATQSMIPSKTGAAEAWGWCCRSWPASSPAWPCAYR